MRTTATMALPATLPMAAPSSGISKNEEHDTAVSLPTTRVASRGADADVLPSQSRWGPSDASRDSSRLPPAFRGCTSPSHARRKLTIASLDSNSADTNELSALLGIGDSDHDDDDDNDDDSPKHVATSAQEDSLFSSSFLLATRSPSKPQHHSLSTAATAAMPHAQTFIPDARACLSPTMPAESLDMNSVHANTNHQDASHGLLDAHLLLNQAPSSESSKEEERLSPFRSPRQTTKHMCHSPADLKQSHLSPKRPSTKFASAVPAALPFFDEECASEPKPTTAQIALSPRTAVTDAITATAHSPDVRGGRNVGQRNKQSNEMDDGDSLVCDHETELSGSPSRHDDHRKSYDRHHSLSNKRRKPQARNDPTHPPPAHTSSEESLPLSFLKNCTLADAIQHHHQTVVDHAANTITHAARNNYPGFEYIAAKPNSSISSLSMPTIVLDDSLTTTYFSPSLCTSASVSGQNDSFRSRSTSFTIPESSTVDDEPMQREPTTDTMIHAPLDERQTPRDEQEKRNSINNAVLPSARRDHHRQRAHQPSMKAAELRRNRLHKASETRWLAAVITRHVNRHSVNAMIASRNARTDASRPIISRRVSHEDMQDADAAEKDDDDIDVHSDNESVDDEQGSDDYEEDYEDLNASSDVSIDKTDKHQNMRMSQNSRRRSTLRSKRLGLRKLGDGASNADTSDDESITGKQTPTDARRQSERRRRRRKATPPKEKQMSTDTPVTARESESDINSSMKRSSSIIDDASQGGDASTQFHEDETLQDDISSSRRKFCVERCNSISSLSLTMLGDDSHSSEFDDSFIMGSAKLAYGASHLPPGTYLDDSFTLPPGEPGEDAQHGSWLDKSTSEYRWKASIADIMALDGEEDSNDADAHAMLATRMAPRAKMGNPGSLSLAAPPPPPPVSRTLTPTSIRGKRRSSASRKQRFIPLPRRQPSYHSIVEHDDSPDAS